MKKLARRDLIINAALGAVAMKTKAEEPPKPVLPTDAEIVATDKTLAHNYTEAERKLMAKPLDDIDLPLLGHAIGVGEDELHALMEVG